MSTESKTHLVLGGTNQVELPVVASLSEFDNGSLLPMLDAVLREAVLAETTVVPAPGVRKVDTDVSIKFKVKKLNDSQVRIESIVSYKLPQRKGSRTQDHRGETILYYDNRGNLSTSPLTKGAEETFTI